MSRHVPPQKYRDLADHIDGVWLVIRCLLKGVWNVIDDAYLVRRVALVAGWAQYGYAMWFCVRAGHGSEWDAGTIAASLGILTPAAALLTFLHKYYGEHKQKRHETEINERKELTHVISGS